MEDDWLEPTWNSHGHFRDSCSGSSVFCLDKALLLSDDGVTLTRLNTFN